MTELVREQPVQKPEQQGRDYEMETLEYPYRPGAAELYHL
jgi:hypothetical protein